MAIRPRICPDDIWRERNQLGRVFLHGGARAVAPAIEQTNVLPNAPAQLLQRLGESSHAILSFSIVSGEWGELADAPHAFALLRARRERPSRRVASFDHLVGAGKHRGRHGEAECVRSLEVDNQVVFGRRLHRQVVAVCCCRDSRSLRCSSA
jgi:hypothetical protein